MKITICPPAYALGGQTQQGSPISASDRVKLRRYYDRDTAKRDAARQCMARTKPWEKSPRNRKAPRC